MNLSNNIFGPLKMDKGDKIFIVSDLHINHDKEFIWSKRGEMVKDFEIKNLDDYNTYVFNELNRLAKENPDAYLISLGDNCFNDKDGYWAWGFANLPFKHIYTLGGNHTSGLKQFFGTSFTKDNCTILPSNIVFAIDKYTSIVLSHYPLLDVASGVWGTLCGHCHGDMECLNPGNTDFGRILDCGVDNALKHTGKLWFTLEEALEILFKKDRWNTIQLHQNTRFQNTK